jgi:hypothetical protein
MERGAEGSMRVIGEVVRLQAQIEPLKVGEAPRRRYEPEPITPVAALWLQPDGVEGETEMGERLLDVHNERHPHSRNRGGENGVSLGFTSHYALMRERFGPHLTDGIAGESILIETDAVFANGDLPGDLLLETPAGERAALTGVIVAAPCVEFSRWCLRFPEDARPDLTVTAALQFLHQGLRGWYATYAGPPLRLPLGSRLLVP